MENFVDKERAKGSENPTNMITNATNKDSTIINEVEDAQLASAKMSNHRTGLAPDKMSGHTIGLENPVVITNIANNNKAIINEAKDKQTSLE